MDPTQQFFDSLGTLATTGNPGLQDTDSWARYLGLGTLATTGNPGLQAIDSWAILPMLRYPDGKS